jgi:DNA-binding transcriptional LysR family regulator
MALELRQLQYFVAVAEERHFGRAAARLRIAQPGLSQQIKRLERLLGVQLLVRDKRHVEMAPAGEVLLEHARVVIELANRAIESTRAAARGKTGLFKIGAYSLGIYPFANEVLAEFLKRYPHVDVDFHPGPARQSFDSLTRRLIDVAFVFSPFEAKPGVAYIPLGSVEPLVVLPAEHRLATLERIPRPELLRETFFTWPRQLNPRLVDHWRTSFFGEEKHEDLVEIGDMTETLVRVAAGDGITITNPMVAALDMTNVVFRRLEDPVPEFEYGVVWLEPSASPFVSDFVKVTRELTRAATN